MSRQKKQPREVCVWTYEDIYGCHDTDCGEAFALNDGTLEKNNMRFCCYCGKPIKEKRPPQ